MMRVAIDCRPLIGHRSGIGRYLYELLREFAVREDDNKFFLYAPGKMELPRECLENRRFIIRTIRFRPALLWLQLIVPLWIVRDRINVFWGPNYAMPFLYIRKYRSVITIHDATFARFPKTMYWKTRLHNQVVLPLYARLADVIITDSRFSAFELGEVLKIPQEKMQVIHLAAKLLPETPIVEETMVKGNYILTVGTIEPRKNIKSLVEAYSGIPAQLREQYSLVVAGNLGWGGEHPEEWFRDYDITRSSIYLGKVTETQLITLYRNATLFVFPSLYEGFGLPVLEALSLGVPVICSDGSSLAEVCGRAVVYCNPNSVHDLRIKILMFLENQKLREHYKDLGYKRSSEFQWAKAAHETIECLSGGTSNVVTWS